VEGKGNGRTVGPRGREVRTGFDEDESLFKEDVRLTLLARTPGEPERDFVLTRDQLPDLVEMLRRRMTPEEAGEESAGHLEVGTNEEHEVVVNLDHDRTGHIVFSPSQARQLAAVLTKKAAEAETAGNGGPPNRDQDDSPWADPGVKKALRDGRDPHDIALLICPKCGVLGYYNEGSHFYCRMCDEGWAVLSEGEDPAEYEGRQTMVVDGVTTLADFEEGAPDGYGDQ